MSSVHIEVEDKYLDNFLVLVNSLKSGMIKNLSIDDYIENVSDEEQEHYSNLVQDLSEDDKEISSKAIINDIDFRGSIY